VELLVKQTPLYKTAVIVHTLNSLYLIVATFPGLLEGPSGQSPTEGVPQIVVVMAALLGVAGLVSAYGAWVGQKWGIWLTIITEAINGLLAMPGLLLAPTPFARASAIASIVVALFVIVIMLKRPRTAQGA